MKSYYVYIMTNKGRTVLYVGMTNSLTRRVSQHRRGEVEGFTERYNVNRLVFYEQYNDVRDAIAREKQLKGWTRKKRERLISKMNPEWTDLAVTVLEMEDAPSRQWRDRCGEDSSATPCW